MSITEPSIEYQLPKAFASNNLPLPKVTFALSALLALSLVLHSCGGRPALGGKDPNYEHYGPGGIDSNGGTHSS